MRFAPKHLPLLIINSIIKRHYKQLTILPNYAKGGTVDYYSDSFRDSLDSICVLSCCCLISPLMRDNETKERALGQIDSFVLCVQMWKSFLMRVRVNEQKLSENCLIFLSGCSLPKLSWKFSFVYIFKFVYFGLHFLI